MSLHFLCPFENGCNSCLRLARSLGISTWHKCHVKQGDCIDSEHDYSPPPPFLPASVLAATVPTTAPGITLMLSRLLLHCCRCRCLYCFISMVAIPLLLPSRCCGHCHCCRSRQCRGRHHLWLLLVASHRTAFCCYCGCTGSYWPPSGGACMHSYRACEVLHAVG